MAIVITSHKKEFEIEIRQKKKYPFDKNIKHFIGFIPKTDWKVSYTGTIKQASA